MTRVLSSVIKIIAHRNDRTRSSGPSNNRRNLITSPAVNGKPIVLTQSRCGTGSTASTCLDTHNQDLVLISTTSIAAVVVALLFKGVGLPIASRTDCLSIVQCVSDLLLMDLSRDFDSFPFRRV
jgi:hypothetical protein